jgi:thiol-disulfide isomerase/thioredoxin
MATVNHIFRVAIAALAIVGASAFAQTNPKDALKAINDYRVTAFSEARTSGKSVNIADINNAVKAKAEEAIKGVDPTKIDAKDAYDWAQLFSIAGRNKEVCDLIHRYLTTSPSPDQKFAAQMLMMNSCNALGEGQMLAMTLKDIQPVNVNNGRQLASVTAYEYIDTVNKTQGLKEALKTLDLVETKIPQEDAKEYAKKMLDAAKAREAANPPATAPKSDEERLAMFETQSRQMADSYHYLFVEKKAELYKDAGQKNEALNVFSTYLKTADPKSPSYRSANAALKQMTMVGAPATALTVEKSYGGFAGLDQYKGKVVIVDFFAHWCGPCKASYPEMRKMYDELHAKGLEIVGFTTYYGFYNKENAEKRDMAKDVEYAKMADFMKEFNIVWPVAYGERTNFDAYGITGIPTTILIDRQGNVHSIDVGYSPESFKKFRGEVEKVLNGK